jgi:hypothetical protein
LKRFFGETLSVFVSSDYDSIATGEEWYRAISDGLLGAKAVIVLLSKYSADRRWINFEAGVAVGAGRRLLPVTIRSFPPSQVGLPLGQHHLRVLTDSMALQGLMIAISEATGQKYNSGDNSHFIEHLRKIEATLPVKGVTLEPFLQRRDNSQTLRFGCRTRETGTLN